MGDAKLYRDSSNRLPYSFRCVRVFLLLALFAWASAIHAQNPSPAATGSTAKSQEGFTPGWGFGVKFEGSSSGDGTITDLATGVVVRPLP